MEPTTKVDENELQKAINNITSASGAGTEQDVVSAMTDKMAAVDAAPASEPMEVVSAASVPAEETVPPTSGESVAVAPVENAILDASKAAYGDSDLGSVKVRALTDLRPLVDKVDLSPEARFKIYKEIIMATHDRMAIEPAYRSATAIVAEKDKVEALLFVVETIDRLGTDATN